MLRKTLVIFVRNVSIKPETKAKLVEKSKWVATFNAAFGKHLLITNTVSCGVLMFMGDLIQQEIEYQYDKTRPERFDIRRLTRMFIVGLSMGPVHHFYYKYINKIFPKRDMKHVSYKLIADQIIMSPICITQFFYALDFLEGRSLAESNEEFKKKFFKVYTVDWCVWPPVQFINFYLLPVRYQVIFINSMTMLYNVFLSYMKYDT